MDADGVDEEFGPDPETDAAESPDPGGERAERLFTPNRLKFVAISEVARRFAKPSIRVATVAADEQGLAVNQRDQGRIARVPQALGHEPHEHADPHTAGSPTQGTGRR